MCGQCGHSFDYHYHDEVVWRKVKQTENLVDEEMKKKFHSARDTEERRQQMVAAMQKRLSDLENTKLSLAWKLSESIKEFEQYAALRPYCQLLQQQSDLIDQAIKSFTEDEANGNDLAKHKGLKDTHMHLQKKLGVVRDALSAPKTALANSTLSVHTSRL